jgi:hypothetical protein
MSTQATTQSALATSIKMGYTFARMISLGTLLESGAPAKLLNTTFERSGHILGNHSTRTTAILARMRLITNHLLIQFVLFLHPREMLE